MTTLTKEQQLEWIWEHCKVVYFPVNDNNDLMPYIIEHAPHSNKNSREYIEDWMPGGVQSDL